MSKRNRELQSDLMEAYKQLEYLWATTHSCPCGARPESPQSHPHVIGCPTEKAVRMFAALKESGTPRRLLASERPVPMASDTAIDDTIFDVIDEALLAGKFAEIDYILRTPGVEYASRHVSLAILTATLPARDKLPHRADYFARVKRALVRCGEYREGVLDGLDGPGRDNGK